MAARLRQACIRVFACASVPGACCARRGVSAAASGLLLRSSSACSRPYRRSAALHCALRVRPRPSVGCARRPRRSAHKRARACARQSAARSSRSVHTDRGGGAWNGTHGVRPTSPAASCFFTCSFSRRGFLPDAACARRARLALCLLLALGLPRLPPPQTHFSLVVIAAAVGRLGGAALTGRASSLVLGLVRAEFSHADPDAACRPAFRYPARYGTPRTCRRNEKRRTPLPCSLPVRADAVHIGIRMFPAESKLMDDSAAR